MEGGEVFASIDSLWFYSSVFHHQPSSKHKQSECREEMQPTTQQQDSVETHRMSGGGSVQAPEEAALATKRRPTARSCREWDERMDMWQKEQRRRTLVVAAAAQCALAPMPPSGEGVAMKAHLRSWAHAVACSVR
uniref:Uncharacterized protein n=1 Tax=Arundo donax TaxID=35708 RepID=A0A0A9AH44_ARUDO